MTYKLAFLESAKKEWDKLAPDIKKQFKAKIIQRLESPHVLKDKLSGFDNCYKIKLKALGYRLVYKVIESRLVLQIIAIGKRDKSQVYKAALKRLD